MNQLLSDENCKCNLQLGASHAFIANLTNQRLGLRHHGFNYLTRSFNSPNGEKILQKCEERTKENYPEVLSGERRTLVTSPPQFDSNSQIKNTSTVSEEGLQKIMDEKLYKDDKELKDINKFRTIYLPQAGERDIFSPLLSCFFHHRELFIHGFEPSQYLDVFISQAENMRNDDMSKKARTQVQ